MNSLIEFKYVDEERRKSWGKKWDSVLSRMEERVSYGGKFRLTNLQRTAFENEDFLGSWEGRTFQGKNLIIQAATSAGKTLLSELTAIDMLANQKHVLVLVPFKAMVKERYRQFSQDFKETHIRIFASSSDYQENDEDLIHGDYDIGILVYEKLFAMLCQPNCRILENCGLIVVDELTMMAMESRGPKLEVALEIAMQRVGRTLRIVCLTTTDCDVKYVRKWLNRTALEEEGETADGVAVIEGTTRPVGLDENIITLDDGLCYQQHIPRENGELSPAPANQEMQSRPFMELKSIRQKDRQSTVLRTILQRLAKERDGHVPKTLIFVPSQNGSRKQAQSIVNELGELFPPRELDPDFEQALQECSGDGDMKKIRELARRGVAYHHASMSYGLREAVENYAHCLDVIVATETLTVGVNLPFEVVIITDNKVYRGGSTPVSLSQQEYKNIIGRAGRLGLCDHGESYLLIPSSELSRYTAQTKPVPIVSALAGGKPQPGSCREEELAPFFLPQLIGDDITADWIRTIDEASLSRCCGAKALDPHVMLESLKMCELVQQEKRKRKCTYRLRQAAEVLAPYAFSLDTTWALRITFGHLDDMADFPDPLRDVTPEDIRSDRYLLDLLFLVCQNDEIQKGHTLDLAARAGDELSTFRPRLIKLLRALLEDETEPAELLPGSELEEKFLAARPSVESVDYVTLFRVLTMYYWTRGTVFSEIRRKLDLKRTEEDTPDNDPLFSAGDLERFAEVCAFQLEAASRLIQDHYLDAATLEQENAPDSRAYQRELYSLSCRVKYGMPRELTLLANRHIREIDRQMLLKLYQNAKKRRMSLIEYLYEAPLQERRHVISDRKCHALTRQLDARYYAESAEALKRKLEEDPELDLRWINSLLKLAAESSDVKAAEWFDQLKTVLQNCRRGDAYPLVPCSQITLHGDGTRSWDFILNSPKGPTPKSVQIAFLSKAEADNVTDLSLNRYFTMNKPIGERLLIVPSASFREESWPLQKLVEQRRAEGDREAAPGCGCIMSSMALIGLISSHVIMDSRIASDILYQTLTDLQGFVRGTIDRKADNYRLNEITGHKKQQARYQILLDSDSEPQRLLEQLDASADLKDYRLLPWGDALEHEADPNLPTVILLDRTTLENRRSLSHFLYKQGHQASPFMNCRVLLDSSAALRSWNDFDSMGFGMRWERNNINAYPDICPNIETQVSAIRRFLNHWKSDFYQVAISYAHYDDFGIYQPKQYTKIEWLSGLAEALNEKLGTDSFLFDGNRKARELFSGLRETSLAEYRKVPVGIVVYDDFYLSNAYCRSELKAMHNGAAGSDIFYIQSGPVTGDNVNILREILGGGVTGSPCPCTQEALDALTEQIVRRIRGKQNA